MGGVFSVSPSAFECCRRGEPEDLSQVGVSTSLASNLVSTPLMATLPSLPPPAIKNSLSSPLRVKDHHVVFRASVDSYHLSLRGSRESDSESEEERDEEEEGDALTPLPTSCKDRPATYHTSSELNQRREVPLAPTLTPRLFVRYTNDSSEIDVNLPHNQSSLLDCVQSASSSSPVFHFAQSLPSPDINRTAQSFE